MAAQLSDIAQYIKPAWVIDQRLCWHTDPANGSKLADVHYDRETTYKNNGSEDLPFIMPYEFGDSETTFPGGAGSDGCGNTPQVGNFSLYYILGTDRRFGLFRRDPTENIIDDICGETCGMGIMELIACFADCVETKIDGSDRADALLDNTLLKPLTISVKETYISELSWCVVMELTYETRPFCRADRCSTTYNG